MSSTARRDRTPGDGGVGQRADLVDRIRAEARRLGFEATGIATIRPSDHAAFYRQWLADGRHGEMSYLARADAVAARLDPASRWPAVRSAIVVALRYADAGDDDTLPNARRSEHDVRETGSALHANAARGGPATPPPGRDAERRDVAAVGDPSRAIIARYARGRDYHKVLKKKLLQLLGWLEQEVGHALPAARAYVDTGPVLERELARRAGLGWYGRNTMLLHPRRGSYFFLGVLLTELDLPADAPFERDHCGTCNACVEACPTGALLGRDASGAPVMDATRCISYLTIEHRGSIPVELRPLIGNRVFGCDICQEVCPWNREGGSEAEAKAKAKEGGVALRAVFVLPVVPDLRAREVEAPRLLDLMRMTYEEWDVWSRGRAVRRAGYAGLRRNVAVALGNWLASEDEPPEGVVAALRDALEDESDLVREHAAWALRQVDATAPG
jgi:epoxyqueuosine reductase